MGTYVVPFIQRNALVNFSPLNIEAIAFMQISRRINFWKRCPKRITLTIQSTCYISKRDIPELSFPLKLWLFITTLSVFLKSKLNFELILKGFTCKSSKNSINNKFKIFFFWKTYTGLIKYFLDFFLFFKRRLIYELN